MNRPPNASSESMLRAKQLSLPTPGLTTYLSKMSTETKREVQYFLNLGFQEWQHAMACLDEVICAEIQRRLDACNPPASPPSPGLPSTLRAALDSLQVVKRAKSVSPPPTPSRRRSSRKSLARAPSQKVTVVPFPSLEDEEPEDFEMGDNTQRGMVPSPWATMGMSEEPGSSSEEE